MGGKFSGGVSVNKMHYEVRYLRIKAGPQRDKYVHILVAEAKIGRKLLSSETVEHIDGNGLNVDPSNLTVVTRPENSRLQHVRRRKKKAKQCATKM